MPESPEVDALARFLRGQAVGRRIASVELDEFRALKTRARPLGELVGATITDVTRYGKHVALATADASLVVSFGRAGWAAWGGGEPTEQSAPEIARIAFGDGARLTLIDAGAFLSLGLSVTDAPQDLPSIAKLGPDPLAPGWSADDLRAVLAGRRKQLRALLQEQESLAGIGGAYSDEILFDARLSPLVHAAELDAAEVARLYASIRGVLSEAFAARRSIPIDRLKAEKVAAMRVHGRAGEQCPDGDGTVLDIPGTKGGGQYCPARQTGRVPLSG